MSEPISPFEPLTTENAAALDLIDHQVGPMTGSRLFTGELKHNVVALTPPFRGTAVSRLQRPDLSIGVEILHAETHQTHRALRAAAMTTWWNAVAEA